MWGHSLLPGPDRFHPALTLAAAQSWRSELPKAFAATSLLLSSQEPTPLRDRVQITEPTYHLHALLSITPRLCFSLQPVQLSPPLVCSLFALSSLLWRAVLRTGAPSHGLSLIQNWVHRSPPLGSCPDEAAPTHCPYSSSA